MRLLLPSLVLLVLASAASAQPGRTIEIPVEKMGNFEIQDLMIQIRYAETPRGDGPVSATITAHAPEDGRLSIRQLYLGGALGDEISTIELRPSGDGTLAGRGMLPPLSELDALHLRMDSDGKTGFNIGMPPTIRGDFQGGARGDGWRIEISMDWPLDVDIVIQS